MRTQSCAGTTPQCGMAVPTSGSLVSVRSTAATTTRPSFSIPMATTSRPSSRRLHGSTQVDWGFARVAATARCARASVLLRFERVQRLAGDRPAVAGCADQEDAPQVLARHIHDAVEDGVALHARLVQLGPLGRGNVRKLGGHRGGAGAAGDGLPDDLDAEERGGPDDEARIRDEEKLHSTTFLPRGAR